MCFYCSFLRGYIISYVLRMQLWLWSYIHGMMVSSIAFITKKGGCIMILEILGVQQVDFTADDNGRRITGRNLFVAFLDANVEGKKTERIFISDKLDAPKKIEAVEVVDVVFNMRGKPERVVTVDELAIDFN